MPIFLSESPHPGLPALPPHTPHSTFGTCVSVRLGRTRACPSCSRVQHQCSQASPLELLYLPGVALRSRCTLHTPLTCTLHTLDLGDAILGRRLVIRWAEEPDRSLCILWHRAVVDTPPLEDAGAAGGWICREEIQEIDRAHRHPRCRRAARRATRAAPAATPGRGEGREASLVGECGARAARDGTQAA